MMERHVPTAKHVGLQAVHEQSSARHGLRPWRHLLSLTLLSMLPGVASANPADLFGLGARAGSMGNAFTAVADDPSAAFYNLGGLSQIKRPTLSAGMQVGHYALGNPELCPEPDGVGCSEPFYYTESGVQKIQQKRYGYDEPHGVTLGLAMPISKQLNFGLTTYVPLNITYDENGNIVGVGMRLARFKTIDPYVPDYVMFQNRAQRFSMYGGVSYEPVQGLGIGVGVLVLANASMVMDINGTVAATSVDGETSVVTQLNPLITLDLIPKSRPALGLFWNLGMLSPSLQAWQVGLSFRSAIDIQGSAIINTDLAVSAQLAEDEAPLSYGTSIAGLGLTFLDFYTPHTVAAGVSGRIGDRLRLAADVTWNNWSGFQASVVALPDAVALPLGLSLALQESREVDLSKIRDTITPKLGLEGRLGPYLTNSKLRGVDLYVRGGLNYEPNPFPLQTGLNNLLNSDRLVTSAGVGATTINPFVKGRDLPVSLDLSTQYHYLVPTDHVKDQVAGNIPADGTPVDGQYTSQGSVFQGALTLQMGF